MAKRKASAALRARLKALRRKHGLGEFKSSTSKASSIVPKRRSRRLYSMAKRRSSTGRKSGLMTGLSKPVMSGVIYAFVQPFVSRFLSRFNIGLQDELVQIGAALVLKQVLPRNQLVNNYANAAIIVNTASLARSLAARLITTTATTAATSAYPVTTSTAWPRGFQ